MTRMISKCAGKRCCSSEERRDVRCPASFLNGITIETSGMSLSFGTFFRGKKSVTNKRNKKNRVVASRKPVTMKVYMWFVGFRCFRDCINDLD